MHPFAAILLLIKKDLEVEFRLKYAMSSLIVYVLATVFIVYISFVEISPASWNVVYWIIFLFAATQAVMKSFIQEQNARYFYYYSLAYPILILLAKIVFNVAVLLILGLLIFFALSLVGGYPVVNYWQFFMTIFIGSVAFSVCFTFISAISIKANNSATLMAILSFPVIIPILLNLIRLTSDAMGLIQDANIYNEITLLCSIIFLMIGLGLLLFPYIWRS
jgi:heme exporter protein B